MDTKGTLKAELLNEKINRANAAMGHAQITSNDDPRNDLIAQYNAQMAKLTDAERNALLEKWGY